MVKGHNKSNSPSKGKGQDDHLSHKEREKRSHEKKGRQPGSDQSGGTKGQNNV